MIFAFSDICKLNLRKIDISCNRIQKIPTVFRKLEVLEEIVLEHNPLASPPAHVSNGYIIHECRLWELSSDPLTSDTGPLIFRGGKQSQREAIQNRLSSFRTRT